MQTNLRKLESLDTAQLIYLQIHLSQLCLTFCDLQDSLFSMLIFLCYSLQEPLKQLIHLRQPCARVAISKPRPEHWNSHI